MKTYYGPKYASIILSIDVQNIRHLSNLQKSYLIFPFRNQNLFKKINAMCPVFLYCIIIHIKPIYKSLSKRIYWLYTQTKFTEVKFKCFYPWTINLFMCLLWLYPSYSRKLKMTVSRRNKIVILDSPPLSWRVYFFLVLHLIIIKMCFSEIVKLKSTMMP